MIRVKKSEKRGIVYREWLRAFYSFSYGLYYNEKEIDFFNIMAINEFIIKPERGFMMHGHKNMEILSFVLSGELEHKDTLGHSAVLEKNDVQLLSTGKGFKHSEFNASKEKDLHVFQIWIKPNQLDLTPCYTEKHFSAKNRNNIFQIVASSNGRSDSLHVNQNIDIYYSGLENKNTLDFKCDVRDSLYIHVLKGSLKVNNVYVLEKGDAITITQENIAYFESLNAAEFVLMHQKP